MTKFQDGMEALVHLAVEAQDELGGAELQVAPHPYGLVMALPQEGRAYTLWVRHVDVRKWRGSNADLVNFVAGIVDEVALPGFSLGGLAWFIAKLLLSTLIGLGVFYFFQHLPEEYAMANQTLANHIDATVAIFAGVGAASLLLRYEDRKITRTTLYGVLFWLFVAFMLGVLPLLLASLPLIFM